MNELLSMPWTRPLMLTVSTLAVGWLATHAVATVERSYNSRHQQAPGHRLWDAVRPSLIDRLTLWGVLVAAWVSAGFWSLTPEIHALITRVIFVIAGASVTMAIAAIASRIVDVYGSSLAPALPVGSLTRNITWGAVATIGGLVVLNGIGLSITPMLTALGVGGLAVALALQEPLSNFFAGVFIALAGQIRIGDYVILDSGQEGYVADLSWRSTRLRMLANNLVIVPNAKLAQAIVINHTLPSPDLAVLVEVGVDYASDLEQVERVVCQVGREVMGSVTGGVPAFEPFIRYHTFADSSVNFTVILRSREFVDQYLVKHEFIKRLHTSFNEHGITIPFPIRTLARHRPPSGSQQIEDGDEVAVTPRR